MSKKDKLGEEIDSLRERRQNIFTLSSHLQIQIQQSS